MTFLFYSLDVTPKLAVAKMISLSTEKPKKSAVELVATDAEQSKEMMKAAKARKPKAVVKVNKKKFKKKKNKKGKGAT